MNVFDTHIFTQKGVLLMKKNQKNPIQISFMDSPSSENVTGSSVYIKTPNHDILLDAGFVQTNDLRKDYQMNTRAFKNFKVKDLDLIFLTHTHGDHIFLAPALYKNGCTAKTIIPNGSLSMMNIMLENCASIITRDARYLTRKTGKACPPVFDNKDIKYFNGFVNQYPIYEKIKIDDELSFRFVPSGHLLKGCQLEIYITVKNVTKKILYTSDLGNPSLRQTFTEEFVPVEKANYVIAESTYGDRCDLKINKTERNNELRMLECLIHEQVMEKRGKILIPSFAQSRTQVIAYLLYDMLHDTEFNDFIYIDSPLATKVFEAMEKTLVGSEKLKMEELLAWNRLQLIDSYEDSQEIMKSEEACIIISSSGMCEHGRVKEYLKYIVPNKNASVVLVGYSAEGTLANDLRNHNRIEIDHEYHPTHCKVYCLQTLSSHMPYDELVKYYSNITCERIYLHHGSKHAKETLKDGLLKEFEKKCKTTAVLITDSKLVIQI